ncbi:CAP domain-containing protein [Deltaproteobacteria bacterium PRO3]|nr:CAP domain-containing protein [Deltaproteobacteria bacterium PRO3]
MSMKPLFRPIFLIPAFVFCLSVPVLVGAKSAKSIPFHLQQQETGPKLSPGELSREVEGLILESSNEQRAKKKLAPLAGEEILVKVARDHSQDMLKRNYLSHFSPEKKSVVDRVKKYQPKLQRSVGENLHTITSSQGLVDPKAIAGQMMDDWMHSSSHRKNILSKDYAFLGVGCASDGQRIFCTQVFGGPQKK